ncbi:uncharacterized protein LOC108112407 [Drosophila eugracilis]|uniref:uncharacterized protein LOC108112407 n=1 Tax=Drosophila eugracilis TaxID=29029 RepID=UPI0007E6E015|nr:uncharacterized protein LOC108112407 [Drosophila eugracilis]
MNLSLLQQQTRCLSYEYFNKMLSFGLLSTCSGKIQSIIRAVKRGPKIRRQKLRRPWEMGNKLRRQPQRVEVDEEVRPERPQKKTSSWPFWRLVYWLGILILIAGICVGMYFTLKSDFGECSSYDVRCD